jgi:hypothetical protein
MMSGKASQMLAQEHVKALDAGLCNRQKVSMPLVVRTLNQS